MKEELAVNPVFVDKLKESGIPFVANGDVNTNSLKSWLSEQLGLKSGSVSRMNYEDIPDFVNFYRYNTTTVSNLKIKSKAMHTSLLRDILDLFFPRTCAICGNVLAMSVPSPDFAVVATDT